MDHVMLVGAAVLYAVGWALAWANLARPREALQSWGIRALWCGALLHGAGLVFRTATSGAPPATSGLESLALLSLCVAVIFGVFARHYHVEAMGAFAAPLVCLTLTASIIFASGNSGSPEVFRTSYLVVHVALAITGNGLLGLAAVAAAAYVLQDRNLRLKKLGAGALKVTNLKSVDQVIYRSVTLGFLFMSLGIVSGMVYSKHAWSAYWSWDPRQVWSLCTWLGYAALLHARLTSGWHGRRWAWLTMGAFATVVSASVVLDVFQWGRHAGTYEARAPVVETP